jgi:hypothetical protein
MSELALWHATHRAPTYRSGTCLTSQLEAGEAGLALRKLAGWRSAQRGIGWPKVN